jgi:serine/threonine-protein kinase
MRPTDPTNIDRKSPPFDQFASIKRLATTRSGHAAVEYARHQLYVARGPRNPGGVLIKVTSKPGAVYEYNLTNEIASLSTINRELPTSPYFPVIREHGRVADGRIYVITTLFDEFPLLTAIGPERMPVKMVSSLRTALEVAKALTELHRLNIFHVDLNTMNILHRNDRGQPVIRIVDFESSYERARHAAGVFYNPPTTPGYSAPEVPRQPPDARSDLFSLGAVLYTMLAGYEWTRGADTGASIEADGELDPELKLILLTAVARDPDRRYPSVEALAAVLAAYLERIWPGRSW